VRTSTINYLTSIQQAADMTDILQLTVLAEKGIREAQLLLNMRKQAVRNQDEQVRQCYNNIITLQQPQA